MKKLLCIWKHVTPINTAEYNGVAKIISFYSEEKFNIISRISDIFYGIKIFLK